MYIYINTIVEMDHGDTCFIQLPGIFVVSCLNSVETRR